MQLRIDLSRECWLRMALHTHSVVHANIGLVSRVRTILPTLLIPILPTPIVNR